MGIGLPVAKFLDISPSPPAPLPAGEGREPANPLPSQREMALVSRTGVISRWRSEPDCDKDLEDGSGGKKGVGREVGSDGVTRRDVNAGKRARLERWAGVGLREWGTAERFRLGPRASLSANESPSGR